MRKICSVESVGEGWIKVQICSATEISFELKFIDVQKGFEKLFLIIPIMMRLDADLMECYDNAARSKPSPLDINAVKQFANLYEFRDVDCALPGFEYK